jgi:hypothetical protein
MCVFRSKSNGDFGVTRTVISDSPERRFRSTRTVNQIQNESFVGYPNPLNFQGAKL